MSGINDTSFQVFVLVVFIIIIVMGICLFLQCSCKASSSKSMSTVAGGGSNSKRWTKYSAGLGFIGLNLPPRSNRYRDDNYRENDTYRRATYDVDYKDDIINFNDDNKASGDDKNECDNNKADIKKNECQDETKNSDTCPVVVNGNEGNGIDTGFQANSWQESQSAGGHHISWSGNEKDTGFTHHSEGGGFQSSWSQSNHTANDYNTGWGGNDVVSAAADSQWSAGDIGSSGGDIGGATGGNGGE